MSHVSRVTGPPDEVIWRNKKKTQKNCSFWPILNFVENFEGHRSQCKLSNSKFRQAGHRSHPVSNWIKWYSISESDLKPECHGHVWTIPSHHFQVGTASATGSPSHGVIIHLLTRTYNIIYIPHLIHYHLVFWVQFILKYGSSSKSAV